MQTQPQVGISASSFRSCENYDNTINSGNASSLSVSQASQVPVFSQSARSHSQAMSLQQAILPSIVPSDCTNLPMKQLSLAEMESIISPLSRRRSEGFVQQEVKLMIKEIEKRRHIILATSPAYSRLKKKAWEEIANSVALKRPHEPKRTGEQMKKKWENIVSKTKKKIREGQVTPDSDWNETNNIVVQFLAAATREIRERQQEHQNSTIYENSPQIYEEAPLFQPEPPTPHDNATSYDTTSFGTPLRPPQPVFPSPGHTMNANASTNDIPNIGETSMEHTDIAIGTDSANQSLRNKPDPKTICRRYKVEEREDDRVKITSSKLNSLPTNVNCAASTSTLGNTDEDDDDDDDEASDSENCVFSKSAVVGHNTAALLGNEFSPRHRRRLEAELLRQAREEHALRMRILRLRQRFWQLKTYALKPINKPTRPS